MKAKIFYIAYKTCESLTSNRNSFQLSNARLFIKVNITLHILQVLLCIFPLTNNKVAIFDNSVVIVLLVAYLLAMGLATFFFDNKTFAKSMRINKNSVLTSYGRLIGLTYFLLNLCLFVMIFMVQYKQTG